MSKLTLSVNASVISRAKRYASQRGISVSQMVEAYLTSVSEPPGAAEMPPVLRSVRGILKNAAPEAYRRHLRRRCR